MDFELIAAFIAFFSVFALMMSAPSQSPHAAVVRERARVAAAVALQKA